jgi:hypothetical protein
VYLFEVTNVEIIGDVWDEEIGARQILNLKVFINKISLQDESMMQIILQKKLRQWQVLIRQIHRFLKLGLMRADQLGFKVLKKSRRNSMVSSPKSPLKVLRLISVTGIA